ncbi:GNAT family N-acetyltransferase [Rhodobacteraceae bacterium KMM 6894]|nr:GNAT family N-acetyltransferase [Rhodobacteraceae bacterium KMM 6894]
MRSEPHPARLRDVPRLTAILRMVTRTTPWLPKTRSLITDLTLMVRITRAGWVKVIRDPHSTAGFIARDGHHIHALYVHPHRKRTGLGRALLQDAQSNAPHLDLWVAEANTPARAFYAAHGFAEAEHGCGTGNDENLAEIRMVWPHPERSAP